MVKLAVYANCQSGPLMAILSRISDNLEFIRIPPVHTLDPHNFGYLEDLIGTVDVVIHQPIGKAYKNICIQSLKDRFPSKTYISFPSIYFSGYFPGLMYLRHPKGGVVSGWLGAYHDSRVIEGFLSGQSIWSTVDCLMAPGEGTQRLLKSLFEENDRREEDCDIKINGYVKEHFTSRRLFHVFNHPSNELLVEVAKQVLQLLNRPIASAGLRSLKANPEYLCSHQAALDTSIKNECNINFKDADFYTVEIDGQRIELDRSQFVSESYTFYSRMHDLEEVYKFALDRRKKLDGTLV